MPLYRVRAPASSRMIYQCDIICILVMPKKLKTGYVSQASDIKVDWDEALTIRDCTSQVPNIKGNCDGG
ncbi:hypothetical protein T08_3263 [Trichinella sp. T8]|nr:hypothetical protein T08_3263 [Trichinella sp. T8]